MTKVYHVPVLLKESVDGMNIQPNSICVDVTFGGGGHTKEIISRLSNDGHLYSFDQDEDAINNIKPDERFTFVRSNFRYLKNFIQYHDEEHIDALLADLGVSSHHFDEGDRGFSFRFEDGALDMRMNQRGKKNAATILNTYSEKDLADVFYLYGELKQSRRIAAAIVRRRNESPLETIADLLDVLDPFVGKNKKEKQVLAQAFQALRIEVNEEMETLREMLEQALELLSVGGRISVITYHSLEDRLVKNFFKTGNFEGKVVKDFYGNIETPFKLVNNRVIVPSDEEIERNPRARSAKLRIAEKLKPKE